MITASIRPIESGDRAGLEELLGRSMEFTREEVACALELVDDVLERGQREEDYIVLCAESPERGIVGFVCYGKTPLTRATYDLYWIVIDPRYRGEGMGRRLLEHVEARLKGRGLKLLVAETSSLAAYTQARSFYKKAGFSEESHIRDFYAPGDDRLIYCKRF